MQCDRASELISGYLDRELDAGTRSEVAGHLEKCAECAALADDLGRVGRRVAALGREPTPVQLASRVRARLAEAGGEAAALPRMPVPRWTAGLARRDWLRQAAVIAAACGLTALVTTLVLSRGSDVQLIERDVAAAHVRSLMQDSPTQIASSDSHTIKPWFSGRLEFAFDPKDLVAEGFPLAGARLDYVGERRVAALVYRRRMHVVNVFVWPANGAAGTEPRELTYRGYNVVTWSRGGSTWWAISDLNMAELRHLQALL